MALQGIHCPAAKQLTFTLLYLVSIQEKYSARKECLSTAGECAERGNCSLRAFESLHTRPIGSREWARAQCGEQQRAAIGPPLGNPLILNKSEKVVVRPSMPIASGSDANGRSGLRIRAVVIDSALEPDAIHVWQCKMQFQL